jgi:small subunit ribosomal protein S19e
MILMTTAYDVPAKELIDRVAKELAKDDTFTIPEENIFSKTGVDKENAPSNRDWWQIRCASIFRKIYMQNGIGIERLRSLYGGKRDRGSKPYKARSGSGSITRRAVQQLEKAGYITAIKGKGRVVTGKGRSFLDNISNELLDSIKKDYPSLEKY